MRRRVFLSHAWAPDEQGRDAHARVVQLGRALRALGWDVWLDEEQLLAGHLCTTLARGIEACDCVAVCLTHAYCRKLQAASLQPSCVADNCLREFLLATATRKPVVPVCMEPGLDRPAAWGSVLCMHMGGHVYADASADPPDARPVHRILCGLFAGGPSRRILGPPRRPLGPSRDLSRRLTRRRV